jgi:hypothetical protein
VKYCLPIRKTIFNPDDPLGEALPFTVLGPNSPLSYREAARRLAENFANCTPFGSAPYEANESEVYGITYSRDRVLLFSKKIGAGRIRCFGAVGMRWKKYEYTDMPEGEGWFMTWAWFHPTEQRKDHLRNAWPHISRLFPDFMPQPPATPAMGAFLKKIQFSHPRLLNREFPIIPL